MTRLTSSCMLIGLFAALGCTSGGDSDTQRAELFEYKVAPIAAPSAPFNKKIELRLRAIIHAAFATPLPDAPGTEPLVLAQGELNPKSSYRDWEANMPAPESRFKDAEERRSDLIERLDKCTQSSVRRIFERLMMDSNEKPPVRLLYAVIAARAGSERGALAILESMKGTDERVVLNNISAIKTAMDYHGWVALNETVTLVPWAIELACAMIRDDRAVTGIDESFQPGYRLRVSDLADGEFHGLTLALGELKAPQALDALMERVRVTDGDTVSVSALAELGDPRAIPLLLEYTRKYLENPECQGQATMSRLLCAIRDLKATDAGPILIEHLREPFVIETLLEMRETRAIPSLRRFVAEQPASARKRNHGEEDAHDMARYALALLEPGDPVTSLGELLNDTTARQTQLRVIEYFEEHPDRRAVAPLLTAIRSETSTDLLHARYLALARQRYRETVDGLLNCLDLNHFYVEPTKEDAPKPRASEAALMLEYLTGEKFGDDKAMWTQWWKTHRESFKERSP